MNSSIVATHEGPSLGYYDMHVSAMLLCAREQLRRYREDAPAVKPVDALILARAFAKDPADGVDFWQLESHLARCVRLTAPDSAVGDQVDTLADWLGTLTGRELEALYIQCFTFNLMRRLAHRGGIDEVRLEDYFNLSEPVEVVDPL